MTWIGWALLSALFAAATALLAKVGVAHVDSNLATAIRTTVVLVFAWSIALALGKHGEIRLIDRRTLLFLVLSGMATGLSWLCYFRALATRSRVAGRSARQAQRPAGDAVRLAAARRKANGANSRRRTSDHRRSRCDGARIEQPKLAFLY